MPKNIKSSMIIFKRYGYVLAITFVVIAALSSCENNSTTTPLLSDQTTHGQPVMQPLQFSKPRKIDWAAMKYVSIKPDIKKLDFNDLPAHPYDSVLYKPFTKPVSEQKFDYNALPSKYLDIDKLTAKPLSYKTYALPKPKLIKAGMPDLKDPNNPFIYGLGEAQGLHGTIIWSIIDRDGFIWILTSQNLYRYDGANLVLYLTIDQTFQSFKYLMQDDQGRIWVTEFNEIEIIDPKKGTLIKTEAGINVNNDAIIRMFEDKQQRIWAACYSGTIKIIDNKLLTVKSLDQAQGLMNRLPIDFAQDNDKKIWLATFGGGVEVIDLKNKNIKHIDKLHSLDQDSVTAVTTDKNGRVWVASITGAINIFDVAKSTLTRINELTGHDRLFISDLLTDDKGLVWASTEKGLAVLDNATHTIRRLDTGNGFAGNGSNTVQDKAGQFWISASKGITIINNDVHIISHINNEITTSAFQDDQGRIWQATPAKGINIIDPVHKTVRHLGKANGLVSDSLQSVRVIKGLVFICTYNGLDIFDPVKNTLTYLGEKQALTSLNINSVTCGNNGKILLGGKGNGIDIYNPKTSSLTHLGEKEGFKDDDIIDIIQDDKGRIWGSSTKGGISIIDTAAQTISYLSNLQGLNSFPKSFVKDNKGNIWINSEKGVFAVDVKNSRLFLLSQVYGSKTIFTIVGNKGDIYTASYNGINKITPPENGLNTSNNWQIKSFGIAKVNRGFFQTDAVSKDGNYWWGDNGFTVVDLSKTDAYTPPVYVEGVSVMDTPRYFVAKHSFNQQDTLWDNDDDKFITGDKLKGKSDWLNNTLSYDSVAGPYNMPVNLHIPYNQNYLQFNFTSFGKTGPDSTLYQYILVGADKKWSGATDATSTHVYYGLAPGTYTFEVSRLSNDKWETPAQFSFTITPPWWQTWWAYLLYVLLFGGVLWCFVYYRSMQLVKANRILEHKINVRTEEVLQQKEEIQAQRDHLETAVNELKQTQAQLVQSEKLASLGELTAGIAHEIQNPLNFVNNFSEVNTELIDEMQQEIDSGNYDEVKAIANDIQQNQQKINHHGKRADAIVKNMLQHSRNNSGDKQPTDINALADEYLRLSYHGLRAKDKSFNANMATSFDESIPLLNIIPQDVGRVVLNLFNNAFYAVVQKKKTAGIDYKPTVKLSTKLIAPPSGNGGAWAEISVTDNGVGIPDAIKEKIMQPFFTTKPTGEGTGLGLSLSYDIVVKGHGGKIDIDTKEGEYTTFIISLPA